MIEIFEKNEHVLAVKYFHEIGKKWKNRKHFILTVLKVGQGKKKLFLSFLAVFMTFLTRFEKTFWKKKLAHFDPPPKKKYEIGKN